MGTPAFAVPVLQRLLETGNDIVGVYTKPDKPARRGRRTHPSPVKLFAQEKELPVFQPRSFKESGVQIELAALNADLVIVTAYGKLLPRVVLEMPPLGCLNIHPSLLPRHRGSSPVVAAILSGIEETGVTVMMLDEGLDTGPLLAQREVRIECEETAPELTARLFDIGADLLIELLPELVAGSLKPLPQDESEATMSLRISREDGRIDWSEPASHIIRKTLAYHPWPGSFTMWESKLLKVFEVSEITGKVASKPGTVAVVEGAVIVSTGMGLLSINRLQLEGRRAVSVAEFLAGHPDLAGTLLG